MNSSRSWKKMRTTCLDAWPLAHGIAGAPNRPRPPRPDHARRGICFSCGCGSLLALRRPTPPHSHVLDGIRPAHAVVADFCPSRRLFGAQPRRVTIRYGGENQGVEANREGQRGSTEAECRPGRPARRRSCSCCRWYCRAGPCPLQRRLPGHLHLRLHRALPHRRDRLLHARAAPIANGIASRPASRAPRRPPDQKENTREEEPSRQRSRFQMAHHRDPGACDAGGDCSVSVCVPDT